MYYLYTDGSYRQESKCAAGAFALTENGNEIEKQAIPVYAPEWSSQEAELYAITMGIWACIRNSLKSVILVSDYALAPRIFQDADPQTPWQVGLMQLAAKNGLTVLPMQKSDVLRYHNMCDRTAFKVCQEFSSMLNGGNGGNGGNGENGDSVKCEESGYSGANTSVSTDHKEVHVGWSHVRGLSAISAVVVQGGLVLRCEAKALAKSVNIQQAQVDAKELGRQVAEREGCAFLDEKGHWRTYARSIAKTKLEKKD